MASKGIAAGSLIWAILLVMAAQQPIPGAEASVAMKRLYEDLFTDYNRLILPVTTNQTKVTIKIGLKLVQILDLNLQQQLLSTNVWVEQTWYDPRLQWDAKIYGDIDMLHVPAENIWIPDIVLLNNADGNYELTIVNKAIVFSNGTIFWKPPTMFRSTCEIDVEYFPFDIQTCFLRFGSWTYGGDELEFKHAANKRKVEVGIDLSSFVKNVEWDIIDVPAYYNENYYECCREPFPDITFKIVIRRKMLFYLVNLILPVGLMTFMTVSVFYLPADSNEKVTLSISILTSLIVFFLLMLEVIPPTSLTVPLFGKYLLFTLVLVSLSACVSVFSLNIYHRSPAVHQMSPRMRKLFLKTLPRLLRLDRPDPRERSSLNRFRKKKIAQQILQARQHNKVYDLAQPLAASLNLIDTLQKSYTFNQKDEDAAAVLGAKQAEMEGEFEEQGRYFRRYVDDCISKLERVALNKRFAKGTGNSDHDSQSATNCNCANRNNPIKRVCCEHKKCCAMANKPIRQSSAAGDLQAPGQSCCSAASFSSQHATAGHPTIKGRLAKEHPGEGLENLHDDTFDMTFDYDDQENNNINNNNNHNSNNAINGHNFEVNDNGHMTASCKGKQRLTEADLPSPPPPPRQLTQLSDSMKDLSGRMSSCSQKNLLSAGHVASLRMGHGDDSSKEEAHQLVSNLINSINLISKASHEIDTTTSSTTTPMNDLDIDYQNIKARCTCQDGSPQVSLNGPRQQFRISQTTPSTMPAGSSKNTDDGQQPSELLLSLRLPYDQMPDHVRAAIRSILFIADTIKNKDDENSAIEDWESMSMVVDRVFLWVFFFLCTFGSIIILALAPSLYDQRDSIDDKLRIEIPASNCSANNYLDQMPK